jgi:ParB family chromosome partitioning protein
MKKPCEPLSGEIAPDELIADNRVDGGRRGHRSIEEKDGMTEMQTSSMESTAMPPVPATPAPAAYRLVAIEEIVESAWNPRRHYDEAALAELAESIRKHGILTPLLVRPVAGSRFEIAAGHRRYRAAKLAGLVQLRVIAQEMSDREFCEILTIENLQRADVHPLEEAEGYQRLIEMYGYTPVALAERVGRSESYVQKRLVLPRLIEPLKDAFLKGELELGHALLLCRLPEPDQQRALKEALFEDVTKWDQRTGARVRMGRTTASVSELRVWIESDVMLDLSTAPWNPEDLKLVKKAGPCTQCAKRTGSNLTLFDDAKKGDHCLDRACWHQKMNASIQRTEAQFKSGGKPLLKISSQYSSEKGVLSNHEYHRALDGKKIKNCPNLEKALVVDGRDKGFVVDICRTTSCAVHFDQRSHGYVVAKRDKPFADIWKDKKTRLDERIAIELKRELWRQVVHDVPEEFNRPEMELVGRKLIQRAGHDGRQALCGVLSLAGEKHKEYAGYDFEKPLVAHMEALAEKDLPGFLVGLSLYGALCYDDADLITVAELYEIDVKAVEATIAGPLRADFEKKKAKAAASHAAKEKVEKAAAKKTAPAEKTTKRRKSAPAAKKTKVS